MLSNINVRNDGMFLGRSPPKTLFFARVGSTYRCGRVSTSDGRVGSRGSAFREGNRIRHLDIQTKHHHVDLATNVEKERFLSFMRESIAVNREALPLLIKQNNNVLDKIGVTHTPGFVITSNSSPEELVDAITGGHRLEDIKLPSNTERDLETFRTQARNRLISDSKFHPYITNKKIGDRSHIMLAHQFRDDIDFHPTLKQAVYAAVKWVISQRMISKLNSKIMFFLPDIVEHLKINIEECITYPQETEFLTLIRNYNHALDKDGPLRLTHPECKDLILKLA